MLAPFQGSLGCLISKCRFKANFACLVGRCEEADQPVVARALYDFAPRSNDELAFSAGDDLVQFITMSSQ